MSTDPFVAALADLHRTQPTRAKWVVVASHRVGRTVAERLAREGTDWLNLRFVTAFSLALETAAPFLVERGLDPLPDGLGANLVMRLLMDLPEGTPAYFRPLSDQPRMGAALWNAVREMRLAGLTAADLPAAAFEDARKHGELQALMAAYERHLADRRLADTADVFREAAAHAAASPLSPSDLVIEAPGLLLPPLARAFVDALPGERTACAGPAIPGLERPRRLAATRRAEPASAGRAASSPAGHRAEPSRLAWLLDPAAAPSAAAAPRIEMFHAAGTEAEVEGVLRRILSHAPPVPLDQAEVACASPAISRLFWEKARRLDLPITVEAGIPAVCARPARALLALCDWIDSGYVAGRLRRLFQAGDLVVDLPGGRGPGLAARLLLEAQATWGRATYGQSLAALAARAEASAADDEDMDDEDRATAKGKAAQAKALGEHLRGLLALFPEPAGDGTVSLADLLRGLTIALDTHVAEATPLDQAASAALQAALDELLALGDLRRPTAEALRLVRDAVTNLSIGASRARPGHLHVSPLESAGSTGRPWTFVAGLQEGGVFPALVEDPVLLDAERAQVSPALATSHDRLAKSVHAVLSRLAVLPLSSSPGEAGVCLSCSCRDLRDGRETFPSWLMLQALRLDRGDAGQSYEDLNEALGTPETLVPPGADQALAEAGWWLAEGKAAGPAGTGAVLRAYPPLEAGRRAAEARAADAFTEFDGLVPAARDALDPRVTGKPVSATPIESLARCPFRFFLEHGLGLDVIEDDDPDRDEWLDPLQRGSALHAVYATLGREARARGSRLDPDRDLPRARELAGQTLAELRDACPPPSDLVFDRERASFVRDVELFLEFEAERPAGEPVAFEVSFGREPGDKEPLASPDPMALSLGGGQAVLVRGIIDRIQRLGDGTYEVIDYKTGSYYRDKWRGTFRGGAMLQHALYGLAAAGLLRKADPKARVSRGTYEFPSARGGGERASIPPPSRAAIVAVLADLFDVIADGAFVAGGDEFECRYCDFTRACAGSGRQAAAKIASEANASLGAYRRLKTHE